VQFASRGRARRGPGLTPLIDVVFLLLVFFMLASRFETEALLPLAVRVTGEASADTETGTLRVDLDAAGDAHLAGRRLDVEEIEHALDAAVADARPVRLRPAADTPLQPIVWLLARARDAGARDVAIERDAATADGG
jgi:biopolymer transport protein ExbD